jgi:hypothetical protein
MLLLGYWSSESFNGQVLRQITAIFETWRSIATLSSDQWVISPIVAVPGLKLALIRHLGLRSLPLVTVR